MGTPVFIETSSFLKIKDQYVDISSHAYSLLSSAAVKEDALKCFTQREISGKLTIRKEDFIFKQKSKEELFFFKQKSKEESIFKQKSKEDFFSAIVIGCKIKRPLKGTAVSTPNLRAPFIYHTHPAHTCVSRNNENHPVEEKILVFPPSNQDLALLLRNPRRHRISAILTKEGIYVIWLAVSEKEKIKFSQWAKILENSESELTRLFEKTFFKLKTVAYPKENLKTPKENLKIPKENLKTPKENPKTPKEILKTPKEILKTPKENLKIPKEILKTPQENLKIPKEILKTPQEILKTPQDLLGLSWNQTLSQLTEKKFFQWEAKQEKSRRKAKRDTNSPNFSKDPIFGTFFVPWEEISSSGKKYIWIPENCFDFSFFEKLRL